MQTSELPAKGFHVALLVRSVLLIGLLPFIALNPHHTQAQITPPITPSGLNTTVTQTGSTYNITGGMRPGNGPNLFHSFGEFGVPTNNIANFLNETALPTNNILGRVTSGNPSNIFGTVQTTGFGNSNLLLMNPAGFLFGPNATVNVGGMVAFTSADYLKLTDNVKFNAIPNAAADALLTASPVAAFGFLGSNPGGITVQGSQFAVTDGTGLSLVGGNITVQSGILDGGIAQPARLAAPAGQISLASIASAGEISTGDFMPASGMTRGSITLAQGATLDVSGNRAGTVRIRGGEFVMAESRISADTINADDTATAVDINVIGNLSIVNDLEPAITARTSGTGNAGEVIVSSSNLTAASSSIDPTLALIDTRTSGEGQAGRVTISTGNLQVEGGVWFIDSGTAAAGNGNDVSINATSARLNDVNISTGDFRAINQDNFDATGFAGNIRLAADSLELVGSVLSTDSFLGRGGDIALEARTLEMTNGLIGSLSLGGSGAITIAADSIGLTRAQIEAETAFETGRDITLSGNVIELRDGTSIRNQTSGNADAGNILVAATDRLILSDQPTTSRPTGFYTNSLGIEGEPLDTLGGRAGSIMIETPRLEMSGGARINTSTETSGRGGNVTITATELISISGERRLPIPEDELSLGATNPGGIFTRTVGNEFCSGQCGDGGYISIATGSLTLSSGARIDSGTTSSGQGGAIAINATDAIALSGRLVDGTPGGIFSQTIRTDPDAGNGGSILLKANSVMIENGAQLSASSLGPGAAGSISVEGTSSPAQLVMIGGPGSGIFTNTEGTGAGGNINLFAESFTLQNGAALSAATSGTAASATGGTIMVNAIVQDGQIMPTAAQSITLSNGASISASSTGPANAGDIVINAGQNYTSTNSAVTTQAAQASGGNITVLASDQVYLTNSQLNASVQGSSTTVGGNIVIDPQYVILQNSQILAQATQGQGGSISITTNVFLPDSSSIVSASSQFGVNGTVNIQSPISQAGGKIVPLSNQPLETTALLSQRCAALASGQYSSFVVAGRYALPTDPGGWLMSPLATLSADAGHVARDEGVESDTQIVSLRKAPSSGLGVPIFSTDWMAGCES